jgi:hypothetical protein
MTWLGEVTISIPFPWAPLLDFKMKVLWAFSYSLGQAGLPCNSLGTPDAVPADQSSSKSIFPPKKAPVFETL